MTVVLLRIPDFHLQKICLFQPRYRRRQHANNQLPSEQWLTGCSWIGGNVDGTFPRTLLDHSHQVTLDESRISYCVFTKLMPTQRWYIPENQDTPLANVSPP